MIDINRTYTADEVARMYHSGELQEVAMKGYVSRANADGTCEFVHWTKANRMTGDADHRPGVYVAKDDIVGEMERTLPPVLKRTPQQRVVSLLLKMLQAPDGKLGLSDEQVKAIVGESWRSGKPLATEEVRRIAAHFLGEAERNAQAQEREQSTRANRKMRREQERLEAKERAEWEKLRKQAEM